MTERHDQQRRDFLHQLIGAGAVAAGTSLLGGCAVAAAGGRSEHIAPPATGASVWDMSWKDRLSRYRTAYDSPEVYSGAALAYADALFSGYKELGIASREITPVLILRHAASAMVLGDSMWDRLSFGETYKLKDPTTGDAARRNPFINFKPDDKHSVVDGDSALDALIQRGAIVLTCNIALTGIANRLAKKETRYSATVALAEVRRHVLSGVYVMPNGVFAVSAAQDAGCHYMRVIV